MDQDEAKRISAMSEGEYEAEGAGIIKRRRFRVLVTSFGCCVFVTMSVAFAGVPVAVMAWRYWFGS